MKVLQNIDPDALEDHGDQQFCELIVHEMPKNYQLWNHRRQIFNHGEKQEKDVENELECSLEALENDVKNYHAWAHRQAVLAQAHAQDLIKELKYVEKCIDNDVHNNSAWTQRAFILQKQLQKPLVISQEADMSTEGGASDSEFQALMTREFEYASEKIHLAPHNKASWGYLLGLMENESLHSAFWSHADALVELARSVLAEWPSCPAAIGFLSRIYSELSSLARVEGSIPKMKQAGEYAIECWKSLQVADPVRNGYYCYMIAQMDAQIHSLGKK